MLSTLSVAINKASLIPFKKGERRLYAIVVDKKGRVVSEATNSYTKTNARQYRAAKRVGLPSKQYCHAEALALIRSKGRGVKLYVARVLRDGTIANAMPCPVCQQLLKEHGGIKSVEYTI